MKPRRSFLDGRQDSFKKRLNRKWRGKRREGRKTSWCTKSAHAVDAVYDGGVVHVVFSARLWRGNQNNWLTSIISLTGSTLRLLLLFALTTNSTSSSCYPTLLTLSQRFVQPLGTPTTTACPVQGLNKHCYKLMCIQIFTSVCIWILFKYEGNVRRRAARCLPRNKYNLKSNLIWLVQNQLYYISCLLHLCIIMLITESQLASQCCIL